MGDLEFQLGFGAINFLVAAIVVYPHILSTAEKKGRVTIFDMMLRMVVQLVMCAMLLPVFLLLKLNAIWGAFTFAGVFGTVVSYGYYFLVVQRSLSQMFYPTEE